MRPIVVLFVLSVLSSVCAGRTATTCSVVPKHLYVEYGSDTEVTCQTSCVPGGGVFWKLNNTPVDEKLSKSLNSSHVVLTLRNFTEPHATLQCHSSRTRQILGGTIVRTYKKPAKLSCVLHHEDPDEGGIPQLLTCRWEHQPPPGSVNYTLLYAPSSRPLQVQGICSSRVTHCTCEGKIHVTVDALLTVRAATRDWAADSDRVRFQPYDIMKARRPPVKVAATDEHVHVTWNLPVSPRKCHCQVRYAKAVNGESLEPKVLNKTLNPRQTGTETLTDVESCTNYTVSVRCAIDKAPWSDWSPETTVLTGLSRRRVKLRLWRTMADPGDNRARRVRVVWTEIPSTCQGEFTYAVRTAGCDQDAAGVERTPVPRGSSDCDVDLGADAHRISLAVFANQSLLAEETVYVPAAADSLPQVTDVQTSSLEGVIVVQWAAPAQPVSGYVIDWTRPGDRFYWKQSQYTNATLSGLLDKKPYNITVTPLFDNKTGHGTRVLHVCSRVGDPGNVTIVSVKPTDKSVAVGWNTNSQEECSGAIATYTVYCGTETGPTLNVSVDNSRQSVDVEGLHADTQYSVYVEASARSGSTRSSRRLFRTNRFDPRLPLVLGVCGSVAIALLFSLGLFCAIQWKRFSEKLVPNPGLSSLQFWSSAGHQKGISSFQPFITPSESLVDHIYTEGPQRSSTCNNNQASEKTEENADPAAAVAPDVQEEKSREQVPCSSGESAALLPSGPLSPYRSQSSVEVNQCKRVAEKTAPVTVYVTLDMCDHGQNR